MDRLVYLYELDSVRNSREEIIRGQQAMFEEIVKNGNKIVLSFNQITDSHAFLYAVQDKNTYDYIIELFRLGRIKISEYKDIRTPSQYIQGAIKKCLEEKEETFLFSAIPIFNTDNDLLNTVRRALKYSDLGILRELYQRIPEDDTKEREKLDYILRYVRMILILSMEELSSNPKKVEQFLEFSEFYLHIKCILEEENLPVLVNNIYAKEFENLIPSALDFLEQVINNIRQSKSKEKNINDRSEWVKKMKELKNQQNPSEEIVFFSEAIVDLCYNYTVEQSITDVTMHYVNEDSFKEDFSKRLFIYWDDYKKGIHEFNKDDTKEMKSYEIKLPCWETAVRILQQKKKLRVSNLNNSLKCYEENYSKELKQWKCFLLKQLMSRVLIACFYIILFCAADFVIGEIEEWVMMWLPFVKLGMIRGTFFLILCYTIFWGIIASMIARVFSLPDVLESVQNLGKGISDFKKIKREPNNVAYRNKSINEDGKFYGCK